MRLMLLTFTRMIFNSLPVWTRSFCLSKRSFMRLQEPVIQVKGGPLFNISPFLFHFQDVSVLTLCFTLCLTLFFSAFVFFFVFVLVCVFVSLRVCVWRFVSLFFYPVVTDFVTLTCHVPCHARATSQIRQRRVPRSISNRA